MLRIFTYTNPLIYVMLVGVVFMLRSATLRTDYASPAESRYSVLAQRMSDGASLYAEAWESRPPGTVWMYRIAYSLAGHYSTLLLRILACLYIVLCGLLLHLTLIEYRIEFRLTFFPALLFALLLCAPWTSQEVNEDFLLVLPVLVVMRLLIRHYIDGQLLSEQLFAVGLWCGWASLLKYQGLLILLTASFCVVVFSRRPLRDLVAILTGQLTVVLGLLLWLDLNGGIGPWWDQTVLYAIDRIRIAEHFPTESVSFALIEQGLVYGLAVVLGLRAWFVLRTRPASATIRERKIEQFFTYWLMGMAASLLIAAAQTRLSHYWLVLPPLVFFMAVHARSVRRRFWWQLSYGALVIWMFMLSCSHILVAHPATLRRLKQQLAWPDYWRKQQERILPNANQLLAREFLAQHPALAGIWYLGDDPLFYQRVGERAGTRYTHLAMTLIKFDWLERNHRQASLLSRSEPMYRVYQAFVREQPDVVFDPHGVFEELRRRMPLLLNPYQREESGQLVIYRRSNRPSDRFSFPP